MYMYMPGTDGTLSDIGFMGKNFRTFYEPPFRVNRQHFYLTYIKLTLYLFKINKLLTYINIFLHKSIITYTRLCISDIL